MVNGGRPLSRRLNTQQLSKTTTEINFLFSAVGTAPLISFLSLSELCNVDGADAKERERGEASRERD